MTEDAREAAAARLDASPDGLPTDRLLKLIGLGVRSRGVVVGVERVREAAGRGTLQLAVLAPDASRHSLHKVRPLLAARGVPVLDGPPAAVLGRAVGREAAAVVGVTDAHLARGILGQQNQSGAREPTPARAAGRTGTVPGHAARSGRPRRDPRRTD